MRHQIIIEVGQRLTSILVHTTRTTGPKRDEDCMNCGIHSGSGWKPPMVKISDLMMIDLQDAVKTSDSPFKACKKYIPFFEKYGKQYGGERVVNIASGCHK